MNNWQHISGLAEICLGFFKDQSWEDLIHQIVETGLQATGAERGAVFLVPFLGLKSDSHVLSSIIATGVEGQVLNVSESKGIAGWVYKHQQPAIIQNVKEDPRFFPEIDRKLGFETKSILCVPLRLPWGEPIGCLEMINKVNGNFDEKDLQLVQILSVFASIALEQSYKILDSAHQDS